MFVNERIDLEKQKFCLEKFPYEKRKRIQTHRFKDSDLVGESEMNRIHRFKSTARALRKAEKASSELHSKPTKT